jgi:hypothetical protein
MASRRKQSKPKSFAPNGMEIEDPTASTPAVNETSVANPGTDRISEESPVINSLKRKHDQMDPENGSRLDLQHADEETPSINMVKEAKLLNDTRDQVSSLKFQNQR